jgi:FkbH-like protein
MIINQKKFTYLDAFNILKNFKGQNVKLKLMTSGTYSQLLIYLKACAAILGKELEIETIAFGTLRQELLSQQNINKIEIFILLPWDFISLLDWRMGVSSEIINLNSDLQNEIAQVSNLLKSNSLRYIFYIPAPFVPICRDIEMQEKVNIELVKSVNEVGANILDKEYFNLESYLINGCPINSGKLFELANIIISKIFNQNIEKKKIIFTDLDNTYWHGVLGEDGINGIKAEPSGVGYIHFIYQSMLLRLKKMGVLIAIVSKNDKDLVIEAISSNKSILKENDFIAICASYKSKSTLIQELVISLNIGLEHVVFIDDNLIEIQEIQQELKAVTVLKFNNNARELLGIMNDMQFLFPLTNITKEDSLRTELYKKNVTLSTNLSNNKIDLTSFLISLEMKLKISDKTKNDKERSIQLINKTNQFNLNGIRWNEEQISKILIDGGKLLSGELHDKNGSHGEIITILIDKDSIVLSFVMSCRVFQRNLEFMFLANLLSLGYKTIIFNYIKTDRNEPFRMFLSQIKPTFLGDKFIQLNENDLNSFLLKYENIIQLN